MTITQPEGVEIVDDENSQSDGNTTFLRAARDGNLNDVLEYLKGSTDINTSNPNGLNALHLASKEGHINIVTELQKRGANVEAATKKGNTALHIASLAGHEEIVKLLVDNGAKINIQAQSGFTPLYMASQEGHSEVVKFLLANGASQALSTVDGFTPLAVALQQGHEKVVTVLLEHDSKGKVKLPALHIAAKKDDVRAAIVLLQNEQTSVDTQTKSGFTPLHIASHYGNVNVGTYLIERGADVNFTAKNNITPLHVASRWGKANMVTCLLDAGATIDERTRDGLTPLHCAARSGHENVVDLLLERGAPYSSKTKNGLTPLHMSAQGDHVDCARLLLYHKAPVDDVTVDYLTPLHVAAHCGNVKTAKLLLDRKCDPNTRALNGFTPLHIACKKNRIKVVELLLKFGASIEATTESGLTPLHVASFMGHMNIVIYLIQHSANPDYPTVRGETALHLAARANQTDIIRILLRNSASVDARAREQQTPLHIAARLGNVDNVVLLLQHGASADAVTKDLYTPLHIAAKEGHEEVASVLLDQGASHDLTTKKGFTPLHIAAKYGNIKVVRLLLQKDANPDVQGKNGLTPLHVATHYNHVNVALLLLDNKASPHSTAKNGYTPLHIAAKKNQMDIATTLLEYGAKPDSESKNGFTPLHLAAQEGHTDMVSLLLEHKASVSAKSNNGLTPLHLAAQEDKVNIAEILVKYEAAVDPQTKAGYTPLHTACHFGQINMVRFLLDHEASVSSTTKMGYTPLHQAAQQGHVMVVNLLLKNNASPNAVTNNGQTALDIAHRLGYISVVETLKPVTEVAQTMPASDDKYKVVSPETMQETLISDSEDEGGDDFMPQSPLFGKPLSEQHVYLPYYEGTKLQTHDSMSLERGDSTSPLNTSYDKEVALRHRTMEDPRSRMTSEIGDAMRYPSYLERGPDYEAEMKYFSGDTLSPRDKIVKSRNESVFSGDYSTLERLDQDAINDSELRIRSVDENASELEYDDDFRYTSDDMALKKTDQLLYGEDLYSRKSVRYGKDDAPIYRISTQPPSVAYMGGISQGADLNDEFKYLPDDSIEAPKATEDYMEASVVGHAYAAPPDNRYTDSKRMDTSRVSSYSGESFNTSFDPDNVAIDRTPVYSGFLVSFMVDARGGAMRGCRHSGVRFIIPPRKASMPTRVTCRLIKKEKLIHPPPLNEGEGLATRILEMGPVGTKFLGPIIIEVPHFASLRGKEREIVVLRSENGEHWTEHPMVATEKAVNEALGGSVEGQETISMSSLASLWKLDHDEELNAKRITRILTDDFPQYFAIVSRIRQGNQLIGEEGGVISSNVVPQVQAVFPEGALTKTIKVGLQAQPVNTELVAKLLGNRVAVSPIVTVEPRRRKFHKAIILTIPVPKAAQKGMLNQHGGDAPTSNLRLLCSIAGGNNAAVWEDLTNSKPLTYVNDCVTFTTTVSARFWLMDCQNVGDAARMATELYREAIIVPFMAKFVVFAKRTATEEGKLRMFCMTDDKVDKTLERQEHFVEVARSRDVEVLQGRPQYVEMAGNLIPVTKSGDQLSVNFKAFRENRVPCTVRIRDLDQEPAARVAFMREPKVGRGEVPQSPICNLNVTLPDMSKSSSMEMEGDTALEVRKRHSLLREHGIVLQDTISSAQMRLTDVADTLQGDWVILAQQLDITIVEINKIKTDYNTVNDQALAMLQLWVEKNKEKATGNALERSLIKINREDVARKCMFNVETVEDEVEAAAARVAMDQSGFDTFKEEVGISSDSSMKRGMSLDVQYDEQDMIKESESAAEESSTSEGDAMIDKVAPQAVEEGDLHLATSEDDIITAEVDHRRPVVKAESPESPELTEKRKEAYFDLIHDLDMLEDDKEAQQTGDEDTEERISIAEDEIVHTKHERAQPTDVLAKVEVFGVTAEVGVAVSREQEDVKQETNVQEAAAILATQKDGEPEESEPKMPEYLEQNQEIAEKELYEPSKQYGVEEPTVETSPVTKERKVVDKEPDMAADEMEGLPWSKIDEVFGSDVPAGENVYEEVLPDGTVIKHRQIRELPNKHRVVFDSTGNECVEFIEEEGPAREETSIEDQEEILPDGTIHTIHKVKRHSVQHVRKSLLSEKGDEEDIFDDDVEVPGTKKEDIIEVFDEPPHNIAEYDEVEKVLPDGTTMKRRVMMNRMVHKIKTHHESFDEGGKVEDEEFEIDEVIPGTESAFFDDIPSSRSSSISSSSDDVNRMEADIEEMEEIHNDGTIITKTTVTSDETRRVRSRTGSIDETHQKTIISEERVTPSPRTASPVSFEHSGEGDMIKSGEQLDRVIKKTIKEGHFQAELHGGTLETTSEVTQHGLIPKAKPSVADSKDQEEWRELEDTGLVKRTVKKVSYVPTEETSQTYFHEPEAPVKGLHAEPHDTPKITITEDHSSPPDEDDFISCYEMKTESHAAEAAEPEGAEGGEDDSTRVMMKRQIHQQTVVKDGQEQTYVLEETMVHQDNETPEELRDSMQQIIDQFMTTKQEEARKPVLEDEV